MVNGFGSFEWKGHHKLRHITNLSTVPAISTIEAFGIRYLVIHKKGGGFPSWEKGNIDPARLVWIPPCRRDLERDNDYELPQSQMRESQRLKVLHSQQSDIFT